RPVPPSPRAADGPPRRAVSPTADKLLAERFARGEIDTEEYRHRLDVLRDAGGPGGAAAGEPPGGG
ncbi:hypothetical protein ACFVXQ_34735, partial [Kitasatospora sp. NPDC058263]